MLFFFATLYLGSFGTEEGYTTSNHDHPKWRLQTPRSIQRKALDKKAMGFLEATH